MNVLFPETSQYFLADLKKIYLASPDQPRKNAHTPKHLLAIKKNIYIVFISSIKIQFLYFI